MCPFQVFAMASTNDFNTTSYTSFLEECTQVKLPYVYVCTSYAGAEIKFGIVLEYVTFVPSPPPSPIENHVSHQPSNS